MITLQALQAEKSDFMIKNEKAEIGKRLRHFRTEVLKVTQAEFAKRLNCAQSLVPMTEKGTQGASRDYLLRVHQEFGASIEWLMTGIGAPLDDGMSSGNLSEAAKFSSGIIRKHDRLLSSNVGRLIVAPLLNGPSPVGRFGYVGLTGTKLRLHAARDPRLEGTNFYHLIEDDALWAGLGNPTGIMIEILREYLEAGDDRSVAQWLECFRLLQWTYNCLEALGGEEELSLSKSA